MLVPWQTLFLCHLLFAYFQAAIGGAGSKKSSSGILGLRREGDRFVLDSMSSTDAAEALQALADESATGSLDGEHSDAEQVDAADWGWEDWLKFFNEADTAAQTQEELRIQMQASNGRTFCTSACLWFLVSCWFHEVTRRPGGQGGATHASHWAAHTP